MAVQLFWMIRRRIHKCRKVASEDCVEAKKKGKEMN
tara:strand:- start:234 stop:341 length:108 start_codon:yes stop_codon:yes gene_type:complete